MIRITDAEAPARLGELLAAARAGDLVEIQQDAWTFRLTAVPARPRPPVTGIPQAGRLQGKLVVPDDFDDPVDELREYME